MEMRGDSIQGTGSLAWRSHGRSPSLTSRKASCKGVDAGGDVTEGLFQLLHLLREVGSKPISWERLWRSRRVSSKCKIGVQERVREKALGK